MLLENALERSLVLRKYSRVADAFREARPTARTVTAGRAISEALDRRYKDSLLARGVATVDRWGRDSALYRWLTTEPEPRAVLIDLRDSMVVGPLLAGAHWFGRWVKPIWQNSRAETLLAALLQEG